MTDKILTPRPALHLTGAQQTAIDSHDLARDAWLGACHQHAPGHTLFLYEAIDARVILHAIHPDGSMTAEYTDAPDGWHPLDLDPA